MFTENLPCDFFSAEVQVFASRISHHFNQQPLTNFVYERVSAKVVRDSDEEEVVRHVFLPKVGLS